MELDPKLFEQILTALMGERTPSAAIEQPLEPAAELRSEVRLPVAADVLVAPFNVLSSQARRVQLRSLSRSGAGILDGRSMQAGEKIVLHLPIPDGRTIQVVCIVRNSRMSGGAFRIGLSFLSRSQVQAAPMVRAADGIINYSPATASAKLIDDLAEGRRVVSETSDRRDERLDVNLQGMMCPYVQGQMGALSRVTVKDISASGGVCVMHGDEMLEGEQFVLQIPRTAGQPLTMICTVVDCRQLSPASFRIGARYETQLLSTPATPPTPERRGLFTRLRRWFAA